MQRSDRSITGASGSLLVVTCALLTNAAFAQPATLIQTDDSWGQGDLSCNGSCLIAEDDQIGYREGNNLFHSFSVFDLGEGDTATFTASAGTTTDNVISRVTGTDPSDIYGIIDSQIAGASFFFLNPKGVMFGPAAELRVDGSFHVATADGLLFSDGSVFRVASSAATPLELPPAPAFGFLVDLRAEPAPTDFLFDPGAHPAGIEFHQTGIGLGGLISALPPGATFSAVAGSVEVQGRTDGISVGLDHDAQGGQIQLAAVPADTRVPLDLATLDGASLDSHDAVVELTASAVLQVTNPGPVEPSRIVIRAGRFVMRPETNFDPEPGISLFFAGDGDAPGVDVQAGYRDASGAEPSIELNGGSILSVGLLDPGGDISLSGPSIALDGANISSGFLSAAFHTGGDIRLAGERIDMRSGSLILTSASDVQDGGAIEVLADTLSLSGESKIRSVTENAGDGGAVRIGARLDPASQGLVADPLTSLELDESDIVSVTRDSGRGGAVDVYADRMRVEGSDQAVAQISALTERTTSADPGGPGGLLTIRAGSIDLLSGGQLRATTNGAGRAGDLDVQVTGELRATGEVVLPEGPAPSGIFSRSEVLDGASTPTTGRAGDLRVSAGSIVVEDDAEISTDSQSLAGVGMSQGRPGDLTLTADTIVVDGRGSEIASEGADVGADAEAGLLRITTDRLEVRNGGLVSTTTNGTRPAGDVEVLAHEIDVSGVVIDPGTPGERNEGGILSNASASATGDAGNVSFAPRDGGSLEVSVSDAGSVLVTSVLSSAGTITISDAQSVQVSDGGEISALVRNAPGGAATPANIRIEDTGLLQVSGGTITAATAGSAPGGTIEITGVGDVVLQGATITTQSTLPQGAGNAGNAGDITISATHDVTASQGTVISTRANDAQGGNISIDAGETVEIVDSRVLTSVRATQPGENAGNVRIGQDAPTEFVVINRSELNANAGRTDAGDLLIRGQESVFISADSLLQATNDLGVEGQIDVEAPETDLVGQITRLPSDFVDPADRLLPPCTARKERTGSFVVQTRDALPPPPDAPLSAAPAEGAGGAPPPDACPAIEESS